MLREPHTVKIISEDDPSIPKDSEDYMNWSEETNKFWNEHITEDVVSDIAGDLFWGYKFGNGYTYEIKLVNDELTIITDDPNA